MASGETELQFRVEVGGINQFGKLNSQVVMLNKGLIRIKQTNQSVTNTFKKQKGVAGAVSKIFYGQAQTVKQLVRNQKIFRREITHITGKMKMARKETQLGSKEWRHYSRMIRRTKKQMRSLPLRKLGTDLRNLTTRMVKMGKNLQWVGRQMMVGITAPLGMLLRIGLQAFESFEKQLVRTQKILALTNAEMLPIRENILGISTRMGVARSVVAGLTSDFAQMGRNLLGGNEALTETAARYAELTLQLELVGQVSANVGRDFIANLAGIIKGADNMDNRMEQVAGLLAKFNMLENTTALSLKDLAEAFPQVSPAAKAAGVDLLFLAGVIGNMKEVGLNATESAHALKFGLQRLINPTRKVRDMAEEFADAIGPDFHEDLGFGNMLLFNLAENMQLIEQAAGKKAAISYLGELVGKRQASRLFAATMNMRGFAESVDQIHAAFARATEIDPSEVFMMGTNQARDMPGGVDISPKVQALAGVENLSELRAQIRSIFQDDEHLQAFKAQVVATDMAVAQNIGTMKTHSEGLSANSATSRILTVAFQELEPALKGLVIDFMGATVAGKVFAEELDVVLMGPAATLARLKNDMKNMLQEFAASFYTALKPAIAAIRQFILKIRDMPSHMKQGIVVMLGMLAVVGPLAFGIAMMMVSFGVIAAVLVRILPQMKSFSMSLLVSKHLAGEAADRLLPFGAGLAVVGKQAGNTMKNIFGLTSAVHAQAAALKGDMLVAQSSFGAFTALVTTEIATATSGMLGALGTAYKGLTAFTTKAIINMGMVAAVAEATVLATAALTVAEAAILMTGSEAVLGTALKAQVAEFTTATAKMSSITAKTSRRARRIILKDIEVIKIAMLNSMAQLGAAGATTVATTAGVAHSATAAVTAGQAKMFSTTRGMFAANNAMLSSFYTRVTARLTKMIGLQKISAMFAARKAVAPSAMAHMAAGQWKGGQFVQQTAATSRLNAFTRKSWKVTQAKIKAGWTKVGGHRITTGVAAVKAVKMANVKTALTTTKGWKAGAGRSAKAFVWSFKGAFKAIRLNAAASATFMQFVFGKASKAIKLAMMGTGIMMILIAVAGAVVFIIANFDKFKKAAGGALGAFKQAWTNLKGTFMEVGAAIFAVFGQIFGGEAEEGADGMAQTFDGVTVAIQFIADALVLLSRIFLTYVRGVIIPIIEGLGVVFGWIVGKIQDAVKHIKDRWGEIGPFIGRVVGAILFVFGLMVKNIAIQVRILSEVLGRLAEGVFWLLEEVFAPVIGGIVSLFSMLLGVVTEVVRHILLKFLDFLKWIEPVMSKLLESFNEVIGFLNWVLGTDMGQIEFNFGTDIDDLKDKINNGFAAVDEGRKGVEDFINDAVPAIVGVAGDVVGGIITGINAAATEVDNNIMGLVAGWSDNLNSALAGEEGASLLAENLKDATEGIGRPPWVNPEDAGPMSVHDAIELAAYEGLQSALNTFVDRVKTALSTAVADQVKAGMAIFEAKADIYMAGFETQIEAINNVKKAEKELTQTIKYETDRRAQINKMALDKENFIRNRTLAIYEGRIEDARNLSVQFSTNQEKSNDKLTQLDDKRAQKILGQQRDEAIAQINQAQEDAKNRLNILKVALEADLNLLAENLPKDEAEWAEMLTGMDTAVTAKMVAAFGPEGAAATSLAGFAGIIDEQLGDTFSTILADVGVDTTGITSVAGTLTTAVADWERIIEEKDFGNMFQGIFDKVNEVWRNELLWEKEAHEWMTNQFDDDIADLLAHIKWLKGELDNLSGSMEQDDPALAGERARREAHRKAREGDAGHDAQIGQGGSQFFHYPTAGSTPGMPGMGAFVPPTAAQLQAIANVNAMSAHRAGLVPPTAAAIGTAVGPAVATALSPIVYAATRSNVNLTINTGSGGRPSGNLGPGDPSQGGKHGSQTSWGGEWRDDDSFLDKGIVTSLNAAGSVWNWLSEGGGGGYGGFIPGFHKGGLVKGLKGKMVNVKAHAGEYILNAQAVNNIGLDNVDAMNSGFGGVMANANAEFNTMLATGGAGGGTGGDVTNIYIDTMIGSTDFAEQQAKLFKEHVQPKQDRNAGKETRSLSSISEL